MIICKDCDKEKKHQAKGLCKSCYDRRWYAKHREKVLARMDAWREKNSDYNKNWYRNNPGYYPQYRKNNPEKVNAHSHAWKQRNQEKVAATRHYYYKANCGKILLHLHYWREANPDYYRHYRQEHPDKVAAANARRRSHKAAVPNTLTTKEAEQLFAIAQAMYPGQRLHLDHVVPLSRGGGTTRANLHYIPAFLNHLKLDKMPQEVYKQLNLEGGDSASRS